MPLHSHKEIASGGEIGIWQIQEEESFFLEQLQLSQVEEEQIQRIKGRRKLEWLAGRYLLHKMSGRSIRGICLKDEYGKPYLENSPYHISISHSHDMAAVIAAPQRVGIDIQFIVEKIDRIAHKFMRPEELESLKASTRLEQLHIYWGAKESLYKAYGRRLLDFREHIAITPFSFKPAGATIKGRIRKRSIRGQLSTTI